ncbi:MAG TPA: hypothetical protein VGK02_06210 [Candidatus Aquicultor sp.]|jgi:putative adenylate-forming enzyme
MTFNQIIKLLALRRKLHRRDTWAREKLVEYKANALLDLRSYAYKFSPYYQKLHNGLFKAPLQELPVLTKRMLMENWDELITDRSIKLADVQSFLTDLKDVKLFRNKYYVASTAGTTGMRGIFIYNPKEWLSVLASYTRGNDWAGVKAGLTRRTKIAIVSTTTPWHQSAAVGATLKSWFVPTLRIDSTDTMEHIVSALNDFQPRSLVAYANMARLLANEQLAGNLNISPEAVFCASEVLTQDSRELIKNAWGKEPFNQYAATETAGIASDCEYHDLHLYEDLVITEIVNEKNAHVQPGEYGTKILVTVLFSRTLPLIRYEMSDSVRPSTRLSPCGRPFALIEDIQGRAEDTLFLFDNKGDEVAIHPNVFHNIMEQEPVAGWQIIQENDNNLNVRILSPGAGFREQQLVNAVSSQLEMQGIHEPKIKVERVTSLLRGSLGKIFLIRAKKNT